MIETFGLYSLGPGLSAPRPVKAAHYMRLGSGIIQLNILHENNLLGIAGRQGLGTTIGILFYLYDDSND